MAHTPPPFTLPLELFYHVFEWLWNEPYTLQAISISCKSFSPLARKLLFHHIDLTDNMTTKFTRLLEANPSISACVEILAVCDLRRHLRDALGTRPCISFQRFTHVRRLVLRGLAVRHVDAITTILAVLPSLKHLEISQVDEMRQPFVDSEYVGLVSPSVDVQIEDGSQERIPLDKRRPFPRLTSLTVKYSDIDHPRLVNNIVRCFDLSSIQCLELSLPTNIAYWIPVLREAHSSLCMFYAYFRDGPLPPDAGDNASEHAGCDSLVSLTLTFPPSPVDLQCQSLDALSSFLARSLSPLPSLTHLMIITHLDANAVEHHGRSCERVARALVAHKAQRYPRLAKLTFATNQLRSPNNGDVEDMVARWRGLLAHSVRDDDGFKLEVTSKPIGPKFGPGMLLF
ncbi:uncharacterized protein BXZ73DRAFT_82598 [Epithele typhae]|uniref:uncharacterized protein n=1 Tax=Epithele typhae TaxID=378194 RepID=UPI002007EC37|nr:uncharacterized protein BXZ73DRAFT_82598 [Epithele typhae]KAH9911825.1 hypothetical protein BXZ73DRAFT_82598 [Epithele typhae]